MIFRWLMASVNASKRHRRPAYFSLFLAALAICVAVVCFWERPRPAPAVTMTSLQGERLALAALRGKVVLVNFWATDCTVCVQEMPAMAALYRALQPKGMEAVFVAMPHDRPDRVLAYANANALPFKVALDVQGELVRAFGDVPGTPTTFVIDKQGRIVRRILGEPDFERLRRFIEDRLAAAA
jgi:peroxiredoxin